jgi:DegV family protein with EDD domain
MTIRIVTDSTCDLPQEVVERLGIRVIPLYLNIEGKGYLDRVEISRADFYRNLPDYKEFPTTATPGTEAFLSVFDELVEGGASEILSIHISESLSATVNVARSAASEFKPVPVTVLDSRQLSLGTGFLVEAAAEAAIDGQSMDQILLLLEDQISRTHVFAALDTLEFLKRSGRMNGIVAGIGTMLQIKPLLKMYEGEPTSERVRTNNGAYSRILELLREKMPLERIALVHTHADQKARELLQEVVDQLPAGEIPSVDITPVIGAHIGPGAVGFTTISAKG